MDATLTEALASQKRYRPKNDDELPRLGGPRRITLGPARPMTQRLSWESCVAEGRTTRLPERDLTYIRNRWAYQPSSGLCDEPAVSPADREVLGLGQDHRRPAQGPFHRPREAGFSVCTDLCGLEPGPYASLRGRVVVMPVQGLVSLVG
mgnify:FL=1